MSADHKPAANELSDDELDAVAGGQQGAALPIDKITITAKRVTGPEVAAVEKITVTAKRLPEDTQVASAATPRKS